MIKSSNSNSPAEIPSIPLDYQEYPVEEVQQRALEYYENMKRRRTVRDFSTRHVPLDIIENCIRTADTHRTEQISIHGILWWFLIRK